MNQKLKNKLKWIDERIDKLMEHEFPHPESMDFLLAERDRLSAQVLRDEFCKIDWEA